VNYEFQEKIIRFSENAHAIAVIIGLVSAVIDNVPLVVASMGMYDLTHYPMDSTFWKMIAYCSGTGGSLLVIGSAAGVAFMGIEKVDFVWYMGRIGVPACLGYFAGIAVYLLMEFGSAQVSFEISFSLFKT
jgi:Na+/H+ antiporter NhaD/arsenite permease-like protein